MLQRTDVIPRFDTRRHVRGQCWCKPSVFRDVHGHHGRDLCEMFGHRWNVTVAHNSADQREGLEAVYVH